MVATAEPPAQEDCMPRTALGFHVEHYTRRTLMGIGPVEYRWRAVDDNNHKKLASGQGYSRLIDLKSTCLTLFGPNVVFVAVLG
jgi:hypothetical protein